MPKMFPLDVEPNIAASRSDMVEVHWKGATDLITANFVIPSSPKELLQVRFHDKHAIVRIVDEFPLSTENNSTSEGIVSDHFAYRVEDSAFFAAQSHTFFIAIGKSFVHYRFLTGWACLDVITTAEPTFSVVADELV